jgi:molecular chaperone GrpE
MIGNFKDKSVKIDVKTDEPETKDGIPAVKNDSGVAEITHEEGSAEDLLKKIEELKEESKNNYDKYLRSQAEIENIIKRNKKDKEEWFKYANESLIKELLQVIDNLENAISHSCNENSYNALIEGVGLTLKGLKDILIKSGLEEVKTLGEDFDPCLHHAVHQEAHDSVEKGKICKEFQKGYLLKQRLIRPAMVVISKGASDDNIPEEAFQGASEENNIE